MGGWDRVEWVQGWEGGAGTVDAVYPCSCLTQTWVYLLFSPQRLYLSNSSCKWALYTLYIVSIVCSLSQNKVGFLRGDWSCFTCQQTDGIIALYWSPVISGCVIRNSTEFPYLEEEERRPRGKLRLWQEFIIAIAPIYIDFVPAHTHTQKDKHVHSYLAHVSTLNKTEISGGFFTFYSPLRRPVVERLWAVRIILTLRIMYQVLKWTYVYFCK